MSDAIERAAEVIWNASRADEGTISATGALIVARKLHEKGLIYTPLPVPADGCQCTGHSQDYGGYVEYLMEYEPSCPEHSEHVWNPRTGMWEHAANE